MRNQPQPLDWADANTPKVCFTCQCIAQLGDGTWICLRRSTYAPPYLLGIHPYNNAKLCGLWVKAREIDVAAFKKEMARLSQ